MIALMGAVRHGRRERHLGRRMLDGYRRGKKTRSLATFYWEDHWQDPLDELRVDLACPPAAA